MAGGDAVVGYKAGLTSRPMRQLLGVDQPDLGPVLGSSVYRAVVAWLANTLDVGLEPGHVIMTGALNAAVPMQPGEYLAEFDRLGPVRLRVVP